MFTVCPKCALTLVVTAADLKVAQGYVRCGRCSNVFNAISALSDEIHAPPGLEGYVQPELPRKSLPEPAAEPEPPPEPEAETPPLEEKLEFDPAATNVDDVFVEPAIADSEATGTFEAIVLETGEPDPTEPPGPIEPKPSAANPDKELEEELKSLAKRIVAKSEPRPLPAPAAATQAQVSALEEEIDAAPSQHRWLWRAGIAALVLLLVIQIVHHYRHDLAVIPQFRAPLAAVYSAVGAPLVPRWSVDAYEVRQLGGSASATNTDQLIVRASVQNTAHAAQPLPLLRVTVQDRFGNRIAARDVMPDSYAPRMMRERALLAAGQRVDVEIAFVDRKDAASFEIDACLASPDGGVNCANH
jgi:predicted Zn finger-like uncharacterized protein